MPSWVSRHTTCELDRNLYWSALEQDEREAIDPSNIIKGGKKTGSGYKPGMYAEPGDEEVGFPISSRSMWESKY